ncbi:uncharacterized protein BO97DRAFT_258305 [Aspergillus homomorphus CBS 101889]|uniref:REJ domain-containing protein n=1 Tax=Aspergillus homomorphus (strain CBS 101889) TaxID=1450537 RepID=A0A395I3R0_ASPHC|nr:hypothetical protein BO97DRAFT_258305 [Aspergillus homomorphus CBS 101889]RAL14841.1 hypothetical protein BO97DRAFT_258305 [Aspergillus homomorphus CBS 101889]
MILHCMGPASVLPFVLLRRPLLLSALTSSSSPPPPPPLLLILLSLPSPSSPSTRFAASLLNTTPTIAFSSPHHRASFGISLSRFEIGNPLPDFRATPRSSRVQFPCRDPPTKSAESWVARFSTRRSGVFPNLQILIPSMVDRFVSSAI